MTDLLTRPILRVPAAEEGPARPVWLPASVAAVVTALGGLVLCVAVAVAVWLTTDSGSIGSAVRAGALGWLVGNGSGLHAGTTSVTVLPLGFMGVVAVVLYRGGRWAATTSAAPTGRTLALSVVAMAAGYATVAAVTAATAGTHQAAPGLVRTVLVTVVLSAVSGGLGLSVGTGRLREGWARLPEEARAVGYGAGVGCCVLATCSAVLLTVSLALHIGRALQLADGLQAGVVGGAVVAVAGLALLPNAMLCAGAFIAGPGFALGGGTLVSPGDVRLGPLPDFPLLAAVPTSGQFSWQTALIMLPVLAGAAAGAMVARGYPVFGLDHAALRGGLAGLAGGFGFGLATALATGSVGPGRMDHMGPSWPATILVCAVAMLLGGAVAAVGWRWVANRRRRRSAPDHPIG